MPIFSFKFMSLAAECDRIISYKVVSQLVASRSADMLCGGEVARHLQFPVSDKTNEDGSRVCQSTETFFLLKSRSTVTKFVSLGRSGMSQC
jgi:hypothetical protein